MKQGSSPQWRKSSYSGHEGGECVEVAALSGMVGVRDSKNPAGRIHTFEKAAFRVLVREIRAGYRSL